jgi:predicted esterase
MDSTYNNLHQGQPVLLAGKPLDQARGAVMLLHGRGASAEDILSLAAEFERPDFAYLAPQAAGNTWYPNRFTVPTASNEPWLASALAVVGDVMGRVEAAGLPAENAVLLGFSQGACLALEWAARHARRFGGLVGLSGGLIGADGEPRQDHGSLDGTPVFLGCSDPDPHIPRYRVEFSAQRLKELGGAVTMRLYPHLGHTVNLDEIDSVRQILDSILERPARG